MLIENSYITISDSNIHSIIGDGIIGRGGTVSISRNFLMDVTGYSVWVFDGNQSDVRNNTIIHTGEAILVHLSATTNVIGEFTPIGPYVGVGIHLANDTGSAVLSNRMVYNTTGIWVNESAAATVTGNIVQRSGTGIIDKLSFGGTNAIKTNEVNEANVGISSYATSPGHHHAEHLYERRYRDPGRPVKRDLSRQLIDDDRHNSVTIVALSGCLPCTDSVRPPAWNDVQAGRHIFPGSSADFGPRVPVVRIIANALASRRQLREQFAAEIRLDGSGQVLGSSGLNMNPVRPSTTSSFKDPTSAASTGRPKL